jgi:NhaP-type Na+/H+ or K+/H+ antiporter
MSATGAALLAGAFVAYAFLAARLERVWISAPIVFVAVGLVLGPSVSGLVFTNAQNEPVLVLTELTLAVLLFADASTVKLREVRDDARLPERLLGFGLPLTIALGAVVAAPLLGVPWAQAALIGTILAPTDAALGLAVVTDRAVPARIRRALNVESGLNDGIATPIVTLLLTIVATEEGVEAGSWVADASKELGLAVLAAIVVGGVGGRAFAAARARGWTSHVSDDLAVLSLALLAYLGSVAIGGNGFVAAFIGGLTFGAASASGSRSVDGEDPREPIEFTETVGMFASFFVWAVFGAVFVGPVLTEGPAVNAAIYAVLSLTIVRMLPVAVALVRAGLRPDTVAFVGWFGPRGLASVVFSLLALEELQATPTAETLLEVATLTILASVVLHGLSAKPLAAGYGARVRADPDAVELAQVREPRVRRRTLTEAGGPPGT